MMDAITDLADIQTRLSRLEDERAVLATLNRYGHSIDYGLEQDWVDCFTEDGVFDVQHHRAGPPGARHEGREALAAFVGQHTRAPAKYHKHVVVEPVIALAGDGATVVSYYCRLDVAPNGEPYVRSFGRYRDTMVRCPDGRWRFKERIADGEAFFQR